jgi:hypothetical protein
LCTNFRPKSGHNFVEGTGDRNLYRYVQNEPIRAIDPIGLEIEFRPVDGREDQTFTEEEEKYIRAIFGKLVNALNKLDTALEKYGMDKTITNQVNRWFSPTKNLDDKNLAQVRNKYALIKKDISGRVVLYKHSSDMNKYGMLWPFKEYPIITLMGKFFKVPEEDKKAGLSEEQVRAATIFHELSHFRGTTDLQDKTGEGVYYMPGSLTNLDRPVQYYRWVEGEKKIVEVHPRDRLIQADSYTGLLMEYYEKNRK